MLVKVKRSITFAPATTAKFIISIGFKANKKGLEINKNKFARDEKSI